MEMNGRRELQGWEEIAAYLGVKPRAAQNYGKDRGLPVYRRPGERGRVFAYADELDAWKLNGTALKLPEDEPELPTETASTPLVRRLGWVRFLLMALGLAAAAVIGVLVMMPAPSPEDYRVNNRELIALTANGKPLWRFTLPHEAKTDAYADQLSRHRRGQFVDLDGDGKLEMLLSYHPVAHEEFGHFLYCFSPAGKVNWLFKVGRKVADRRGEFSDVYWQDGFVVARTSDGNGPYIVTTAHHSVHYPNRVAVLNRHGELVREYWHPGHLRQFAKADLDGDGVQEVLLGGVNNGFQRATLVVVDPRQISGASSVPVGDSHQFQGLVPAKEKAVVLFPPSCVAKQDEFTIVSQIRVINNHITVVVQQSVDDHASYYLVFELDWNLKLIKITPSETLLARHREMERQGILNHAFSLKEIDDVRERVIVRR